MIRKFASTLFVLLIVLLISLSAYGDDDRDDRDHKSHRNHRDESATRLPVWENSAADLLETYNRVMQSANQQIDALAALDMNALTFDNTIKAYEEIMDLVRTAYYRSGHLYDVHPDPEVRQEAMELGDLYSMWFVDVGARGDVYQVIKAFADTHPQLDEQDAKLMEDIIKSFERAGFNAQGVIPPEIINLKKEIIQIESAITRNLDADASVKFEFTEAEMAGIEVDMLSGVEKQGSVYLVKASDWNTLANIIMKYSPLETSRKKAMTIAYSLGNSPENVALINELLRKRIQLAHLLGYATWNDYKTAGKMAGSGQTAYDFVTNVSTALRPKLNEEVLQLQTYVVTTGAGKNDDNGNIDSWDVRYFQRLYEKAFNVDFQSLEQYFPYRETIDKMLGIFEKVFKIKFKKIHDPNVWHPDVETYAVKDKATEKILGYLYLDMFPRLDQGKYNHYECNGPIRRKELDNGDFRRPVNILVCNFPLDGDGNPKPFTYSDMKGYLFHEFGHAMQCILNKTRYASHSGFDVPDDFVEVPSKMLEEWPTDEAVFEKLATGLPAGTAGPTVAAIKAAARATTGLQYERQFAFGRMDLILHGYADETQIPADIVQASNDVLAETYLPFPEASSMLTSFEHILIWGYDAGYYSYKWSEAIVAEMAAKFEASPDGFMDRYLGMKLRKEIYQTGASRDVNVSVESFLDGPLDPQRTAFLERLGLSQTTP